MRRDALRIVRQMLGSLAVVGLMLGGVLVELPINEAYFFSQLEWLIFSSSASQRLMILPEVTQFFASRLRF